jgi:hypothetical protein
VSPQNEAISFEEQLSMMRNSLYNLSNFHRKFSVPYQILQNKTQTETITKGLNEQTELPRFNGLIDIQTSGLPILASIALTSATTPVTAK